MNIPSRHIPVIAFTGGDSGGKSSVIAYCAEKLAEFGWHVIVCSETATQFITDGIAIDGAKLSCRDFQEQILLYQIERENRYLAAARCSRAEKIVMLCDRGTMDGAAYINPKEFMAIADANRLSIVHLRDERYRAVIYLATAAKGAAEFYTYANNKARVKRTMAEAIALDDRTLIAWIGCPHLWQIDNSTDFEGKKRRAFQHVCRSLGIPVPIEIERKYLIAMRSWSREALEKNVTVRSATIRQRYLLTPPGDPTSERRVRERGDGNSWVYYLTEKHTLRPGVRAEPECQVSAREYAALLETCDPDYDEIHKIRHCFVWRSQYFELDEFISPRPGLLLLEVEVTEETSAVELPPFLHILGEVTNDERYSNRNLARKYF